MTEKTNKATLTTSIGTGGHNNKPLNQFEITTVTLSAVEWLQEQYNQCPKYEERIYEQDWEKAKEMEREQSNAKIQKAIEVFEEAKSKAITIEDMFYYLDIVLVALEGIKNETFKSE